MANHGSSFVHEPATTFAESADWQLTRYPARPRLLYITLYHSCFTLSFMKFGDYLRQNAIAHWRENYVQYDKLKRELKSRQLHHTWTEDDEAFFSQFIMNELFRIGTFVTSMAGHLSSRIQFCEQMANSVLKQHQQDERRNQCATLLEDLQQVLCEVRNLSNFSRLNFTGFQKILKKHDKWTHLNLRQSLTPHFRGHPLDSQRLDIFFTRISHLQDLCRMGNVSQPLSSPDIRDCAPKCSTTKYWVHPDHITELKATLLFNMPLLQDQMKNSHGPADTTVSSVYFDNEHFDLYTSRLQRDEGAETIRFQWLGPAEHAPVHIERKTHYATLLDETTIKDRFSLKAAQVDKFVNGQLTPQHIARNEYTSKEEANDVEFTAKRVQTLIQDKELQPVMRCFYQRTTFQHQGDQRLQVNLDTSVTFIAENNDQRENHWRHNDKGHGHPLDHEDSRQACHFPYAILQTRLQMHQGQEPPEWLIRLTTSHLVHKVPRFSKYLHGASRLFLDNLPLLPKWLSELDRDLRRNDFNMTYGYPMSEQQQTSGTSGRVLVDMRKPFPQGIDDAGVVGIEIQNPVLKRNSGHMWTDKPLPEAQDAMETPRSKGFSQPAQFLKLRRTWLNGKGGTYKGPNWLPSSWQTASRAKDERKGKIRIEPKVFFANERTFISWLQFSALLLTVALSLLNFGDHTSRICGGFFIIIATFLAMYAFGRYQYRSWQIRTRSTSRYDDLYGPAVLCVLLVIALIVNFGLRFSQPAPSMMSPYGNNTVAISNGTEDTVTRPTHHVKAKD